ncbi:MAG: GH92 family glycosyl hydrolase, partial [Bacteroidota bacterium]
MRTVFLFSLVTFLCTTSSFSQPPASLVNPFIGTSNYGATHPGANYPHAMASVTPFNVAHSKDSLNRFEKDSEWHSRPYVHENRYLTGFSHVNLSGVGCPELGSIIVMPTTGALIFDSESYGSQYTEEAAEPGYYSSRISKYDILAEVTSTRRSGLSRFSFPAGKANILLNLGLGLTNETGASVQMVSDTEIEGFKTIGTFCYHPEDVRPVYFVLQLNTPPRKSGLWKKMPKYGGAEAGWISYDDTYKPYEGYRHPLSGEDIGAYFQFESDQEQVIEVKVGISYVSIENARANLKAEQPRFDFEKTRIQNYDAWNELLGRITIKSEDRNAKTIFYTGLYHTLLHPNLINDVNGDYPLMGQYGTGNTKRNRYSVYSLWDTYRNVHPFLSLVYPELQSDMVNTMVDMYLESGWLPKWELAAMETGVMVGDPATPVIADTYLRGIKDFDVKAAYERS